MQVPVPLQAAKIETNTRYAESDAEFWFELQQQTADSSHFWERDYGDRLFKARIWFTGEHINSK